MNKIIQHIIVQDQHGQNNNNFMVLQPCHSLPTADLTSTCLQREMQNYPTSLGVIYGQHIESPSRYWLSILGKYKYNKTILRQGHLFMNILHDNERY